MNSEAKGWRKSLRQDGVFCNLRSMFISALLPLLAIATPRPFIPFGMDTAAPVTHRLRVGDIIACAPTPTGETCELLCASEETVRREYFSETVEIPTMHWDVWSHFEREEMSQFFDDWERVIMMAFNVTIESSDTVRLHARLPSASKECRTSAEAYAGRGYAISFVTRAVRATPVIHGEWREETEAGNVVRSLRMHDLAEWMFPNRGQMVATETNARFSHMTIAVETKPIWQFDWANVDEHDQPCPSLFCEEELD